MEIWRRFYPVSLRWLSPEEGGKRNLQNMGEHYYPVFLLDQDVKRESWWSVDVIVANRECDNWHATELSLVFCDSEASLKVQEKSHRGSHFNYMKAQRSSRSGSSLQASHAVWNM